MPCEMSIGDAKYFCAVIRKKLLDIQGESFGVEIYTDTIVYGD